MVVLLLIDGLRAASMMSEQMVLWEHEANAEEKTPDLSAWESWKKQGKLKAYIFQVNVFCVAASKTFPLCLPLLRLPRPLLCPDRLHAEILVCPPLHRPHPGKHQSWRILQS